MRKFFGALLFVITAAACNGDSTAPGDGTVFGNYVLLTANAKAVPTVVFNDAEGTYEVLRGRIVLRDNFTFVDSQLVRNTPPGGTATEGWSVYMGSFVQTGDNLGLTRPTSSGFTTYYLTWINGNTLTFADEGLSLVYRK